MRRWRREWRRNEWHILVMNAWMSKIRAEFEQNAWHERGLACRFMALNTPIAINFDLQNGGVCLSLQFLRVLIASAVHFDLLN
jgi:hypothetical protein